MFGSNSGSSWANPQGNQQQNPQQTGAFGQPAGFGAGNAFGAAPATNAFGQPQQQPQQQAANPMFGNLGGTPTTTPSTGFGAFGGAPANTANTGGLFGQPKPTTGFGAFGGTGNTTTGTFGAPSTGAFGATGTAGPSTGNGVFGQASQPSTSTNAFGGGGLFGAKPATGFGTATTPAIAAPTPVTTGSVNPPYAPHAEKDSSNPSLTLQYHSISCIPAYRGSSFEELRVQDYQQGRKTASTGVGGAFGQGTFGAATQPQPAGLFGQPAQAATPAGNSMFGSFGGANNTNTTTTGTTSGFGAFGQPQNNTTTPGTGLFGSGGGAFGQNQPQPQQPQQQTAGFGAFGQPQQQNAAAGGLFGAGGAFGANNQQKPAGFGAFGNPGTTGAFGGTGAFGQPQQQQQQQTQPGTTGTGLFGQQPQQQQSTAGFGAFGGNNNAPKPGLFGQPAQTTTGFGAFGQNQQQQQPAQAGGGLFGTNTNTGGGLFGTNNQQPQQQQQGGGLFGQSTQQPATGGGLFGGGGGLFGANNQTQNQQQPPQQQQQQQNTGFGLFGAPKPAAAPTNTGGGLFGSTFGQPAQNQTQTNNNSLFGSTLGQPLNQQNTNAFGSGGLFGAKPAAPLGAVPSAGQQSGGSLFGNTFVQSTNMNASSLGLGQSAQPQLTASIAEPVSTTLPIFSMLPPGPRSIPLDQPKKKTNYFADVPTRAPLPRLGLGYTPAMSKLRGYSSISQAPGANGASTNALFGSNKPNALSMNKAANGKSTLGPESFLTGGSSSPALGTGARKSFKKLILDKRVEPADLLSKSSVYNASRITFSPALSVAAREKDAATATNRASPAPRPHDSPSPAPQRDRSHNHFTAQAAITAGSNGVSPQDDGVVELQEGDYWVSPDLANLRRMSHEELVSVKGLAVGRKGYGMITFLEPVDLTNVPRLSGLLGELVRFDDKECSVYPDSDDAEKPPPGSGLNVKSRIELYRCWALDKATREPIKDEKNPHAVRHFKRLKNMKHTHFEGFDIEEGKWTFTVDHF